MLTNKRLLSLCIVAALLFCCFPVVPAQADAFQDIRVEYPVCVPYTLYKDSYFVTGPVVKAGDVTLQNNVDYTYKYSFAERQMELGQSETLTVTGIGAYAGFSRTYPVAVVKADMATDCVGDAFFPDFQAAPLVPDIYVRSGNALLTQDVHYTYLAKDNVNIGKGTTRVIGIGDYFYGNQDVVTSIGLGYETSIKLQGSYMGQADGTLSENYYYSESYVPAGKVSFSIDSAVPILAYYQLYRVEGEEMVPVASRQTDASQLKDPAYCGYTYDFSSVYEDAAEEGGQVYALVYTWGNGALEMYAGVLMLGVIAKIGPATQIEMEHIENDGDFRKEYFNAVGTDGVVESVAWESSNAKVATVEDGIVTMHAPGTATITAKFGQLETSAAVTASEMDIRKAVLFHYDDETGEAAVIYENRLLEEGVDYTLTAEDAEGVANVTVSGCGLFSGHLLRQFDTQSGEAVGHTHTFGDPCATKCESCDFIRSADAHTPGDKWHRDLSGHWHVCKLCGEKEDYAEHTYTDAETCAVCGSLNLPGDMNNDYEVTDADAVYLLRYTLFPDSYPITRNGDFNNDGSVTDADAVYLLRYTLFPESYPIQ